VEDGSKNVRAVVLQGRVMISFRFLPSSLPIHSSWARESHELLMHGKQQSVRTIYGVTRCFRNDDNDLRVAVIVSSVDCPMPHM